jgi:hypothetical protein
MSGFAGGFLQGMAGGINVKNARAERQRELSIMEAMGKDRAQQARQPISIMPEGAETTSAGPKRARAGMGSQPVAFNNWMSNPDIARGIIDTAQSLEMDPEYLATIISYETAGTFDPTKRGPTTQWGQHRGFIQFGEPQAKQHGVDWNNPIGSQLGADGAVARYFRSSGWKPGMGLLDAYSIVNAGGPGRHNRSDANNGGAPGTVADKVNNQMAGHRAKASAMLDRYRKSQQASEPAPQQQTAPQNQPWATVRELMTRITAP